MSREERVNLLKTLVKERILFLDGGMGTMIQRYQLTEEQYRGSQFADHPRDLKGDNDLINLTRPDVVREIQRKFLEAGADILETNTFNGTSIAQADYGMEAAVYEINRQGALLAREVADEMTRLTPEKPRFVAGAIGPTNRTASMSPNVNDPGFRNVTFDDLHAAYKEAARGLVDGGSDMILIETVFDTLNCKAAIFAVQELLEEMQLDLPLMVSGTITDLSGRTLSGQTVEAFWNAIRHARPFAVGLNCALGGQQMRPHVVEFARIADTNVLAYPNAGLPNELGQYEEAPEKTASFVAEWAKEGLINIAGGCCGITPEHIRAIVEAASPYAPRKIPEVPPKMRLAGLEALNL